MSAHRVRLLDPAGVVVATATVADAGDHFAGAIDLTPAPAAVRAAFGEYEEVVLGQMFSFLDEAEAKVAALGLRAALGDGPPEPIANLQVYPTSGEVSFHLLPASGGCGPRTRSGMTPAVRRPTHGPTSWPT